MRELAEALGVSASTVSLALRNDPRVARETCRRVQEFAREQRYWVDPSVTALMSHVRAQETAAAPYRETLGWLNPNPEPDFFTRMTRDSKYIYGQFLWQGARERAEQLGLKLDLFWLKEPRMTGRRMGQILAARGIRGILIPPLPKACGHLRIDWDRFSVTALSYTMVRPRFDRVVPDHHSNMILVLRMLRKLGCRRIGVMTLPYRVGKVEDRFLSAYYAHVFSLPESARIPILTHDYIPGKEPAEIHQWRVKYRPDAVIMPSLLRPWGLALQRENPRLILAEHPHGLVADEIMGVDECPARVGAMAVDHNLSQIHRNERGVPESSRTVLVKGEWLEPVSTR